MVIAMIHTCIMPSLCESYQMFKDNLRCEPYITLLNTRQRITLCKFRCGNTNTPIVSGRYQTVNRSERTCNLCDAGVIGNEFHYIFKCKAFSLERKLYIYTKYKKFEKYAEYIENAQTI